jgi:hypothetical protein
MITFSKEESTLAHTITEVVYCSFDWSLTEFRPGPLKTVLKSARKIKWSSDAKVKFCCIAVVEST